MRLIKFFEEFEVGNSSISNMNKYLTNMELSLDDKLFWLDIINNIDVIVDFGTADGAMLDKLSSLSLSTSTKPKLIGYDIDNKMIAQAKSRLGDKALLTSKWEEVINQVSKFENPMIFLSSVIHEVYSYTSPKNIKYFWENQVFGGDFKYIVIRDMIPSIKTNNFSSPEDVEKIRKNAKPDVLEWFEKEWGPIDRDYRNLLHFLLKYRYEDNFDREMSEYYVPVTLETVKKKIPSNYKIIMEDHYVLPFLKQQVKKDFDIDIKEATHVKLIIEKY